MCQKNTVFTAGIPTEKYHNFYISGTVSWDVFSGWQKIAFDWGLDFRKCYVHSS